MFKINTPFMTHNYNVVFVVYFAMKSVLENLRHSGLNDWRDKINILGKELWKTGMKLVVPPEIRIQCLPSNKPKHLPLH
jgi:hypothetical protein